MDLIAAHWKTLHHENYKSISQTTHKNPLSMLHTRTVSHHKKRNIHSYIKFCTSNTIGNQPVKTQNCLHFTNRTFESIFTVELMALVSFMSHMLIGYLTGGDG